MMRKKAFTAEVQCLKSPLEARQLAPCINTGDAYTTAHLGVSTNHCMFLVVGQGSTSVTQLHETGRGSLGERRQSTDNMLDL